MASRFKKTTRFTKSTNPMGELAGKFSAMASSLGDQPSAKQVKESAQQIWLAGLGAFSKAQNEGRKVFDSLVKQGEQIEQRTRNVAEATIETAKEQASKTFEMAAGKFDKLEQVFESRVHSSLNRLGVLTSKDVEGLSRQVAELSESVRALLAQGKRAVARPVVKKPAVKAPAKKVVRKVVRKVAIKSKRA